MQFDVNIKNLGMLADETVRVGGLTVFAGLNGTGKSFVSKSLYSVFDAMNARHALVEFGRRVSPVRETLSFLKSLSNEGLGGFVAVPPPPDLVGSLEVLSNLVSQMGRIAGDCRMGRNGDSSALISDDPYAKLADAAAEVKNAYERLNPLLDEWANKSNNISQLFPNKGEKGEWLVGVDREIKHLCAMGKMSARDLVVAAVGYKVSQSLLQNFQVPDISALKKDKSVAIDIDVDGVGKFSFGDDSAVELRIEPAGLHQLQKFSKVVFLESPALWKSKVALQRVRDIPRFFHPGGEKERLIGVPGYFYDLTTALQEPFTGKPAFGDLFARLSEVIGGKVVVEGTGAMTFHKKDGGKHPLSIAAMGIANLGVLGLLAEQNILDKDSVLFIDEPEAHLHPGWQVVMIEALFELARGGVHVVIATHSSDIMERLSALVKKYPESEKIIALNHFSRNGVNQGEEKEFRKRMGGILEELTKPFSDSYMMGQDAMARKKS